MDMLYHQLCISYSKIKKCFKKIFTWPFFSKNISPDDNLTSKKKKKKKKKKR